MAVESELVLVLIAATKETALAEMRELGRGFEKAGLGKLRDVGSDQREHVEVFGWLLTGPEGKLIARLYDDANMPAIYLSLTAEQRLLDKAVPIAKKALSVASAPAIVDAAEHEHASEPRLIMLAALAATPELVDRVVELIRLGLSGAAAVKRQTAARAAGILSTPVARALVEQQASTEPDEFLKAQLQGMLERWSVAAA